MDLSGFCRYCLTEDDAKTPIVEDPDGLAEKINMCLPNKVSNNIKNIDDIIIDYANYNNYYNYNFILLLSIPVDICCLISFQKKIRSQK